MIQSDLLATNTLGQCDFFTAKGDFTAMPVARCHIFTFDIFRGGGVMDPAQWNQYGIDSGAESPESESIFSS